MARLALLAQICVLAGLAWALQGCCCGVTYLPPKPGPPGYITGQIHLPPTGAPRGLEIYALDAYSREVGDGWRYVATHAASTETSYTLALPPGIYNILARLDGDPLGGGAYTFNVQCSFNPPCGSEAGNAGMPQVWLDSHQVVAGIDIGDWGTPNVRGVLWNIDVHGSPLPLKPEVSPSPIALASRPLPAVPSTEATTPFTNSIMHVTLQIPAAWATIAAPIAYPTVSEAYFANEGVTAPLGLDHNGVWLTVENLGGGCPFPDWRYAKARSTVKMQGGSNHFFFQDPPPRDGPQPFVGYSVRGGTFVYGDYCVEFTLTGVTRDALESNLAAFFGIVESAAFAKPF